MMKKTALLINFLFCVTLTFAQDLDDINELMGKLKYKEAKEAIDKYFQNPKKEKEAEGWYYKGRIYNSLSQETSMEYEESFTLKSESFNAFRKYQSLDSKDVYLLLEGYNSYLGLYFGYYDLGAKAFNNKKFGNAITAFKKAIEIKDFILSKKYDFGQTKLYPLDTSLILNIATAALQDKNEEEAIKNYKILAEANIVAEGYKEIYEYIADYYFRKNDLAALNSILIKGKKLYPEDDYWNDLEIRAVSKNGDKKALYAKYEEMIVREPSSFLLSYNYAVELYNSIYGKEASNTGDSIISNKLVEALKKAIANESKDDITATILLTNHLYNMSADKLNASNVIKSTKADDVKKKAGLKSEANKYMDDCIYYGEIAIKFYEGLASRTAIQKANYKILLSNLSDLYSIKKNPAKATEYENKNKAAEKL